MPLLLRRFPACLALLVLVVLAACSRVEPQALRVQAPDKDGLARWRRSVATKFSAQEWREFDGALQQIRAQISATSETHAEVVIDAGMCEMIDGRTWREVHVIGVEAELHRLGLLRAELKKAVDGNALLVTRREDGESARALDAFRARQETRLRELDGQIAGVVRRRALLVGAGAVEMSAERGDARPDSASTASLTREEARAQIERLIAAQCARARFRYGPWPAKIDRDGSVVTGDVLGEYQAARAAAPAGHEVIGVRLKGRWWIFSGPAELPHFAPAVLARLTPADLAELKHKWAEAEAEIWARKSAFEQLPAANSASSEGAALSKSTPPMRGPTIAPLPVQIPRIAPSGPGLPVIAPEKPPPSQLP